MQASLWTSQDTWMQLLVCPKVAPVEHVSVNEPSCPWVMRSLNPSRHPHVITVPKSTLESSVDGSELATDATSQRIWNRPVNSGAPGTC